MTAHVAHLIAWYDLHLLYVILLSLALGVSLAVYAG